MSVVLPIPVPLRATVAGLLLALLVTVRVPVRAPDAVGVNDTDTVQEPPTARLAQSLVWLKSPVTATLETAAAVVPELVTVTVCPAAVEPTTVPVKDRLPRAAVSTRPGAGPGPGGLGGCPPRRGRKLNAGGAGAARRDRRAAGVGLAEVAGHRDRRDRRGRAGR